MAPKSSENAFASTAEEARPCWEGAKAAAEPAAAAIRVSVNVFIVNVFICYFMTSVLLLEIGNEPLYVYYLANLASEKKNNNDLAVQHSKDRQMRNIGSLGYVFYFLRHTTVR